MPRALVCLSLLIPVLLSLDGCGAASQSSNPSKPSGPTVTSLAVSPADVNVGQQLQMTATATYSDGSHQVVTPESWSSSNASVASITSSGVVAGVAHGQSTISATFSGVSGSGALSVHGGTLSVDLSGAVTGSVAISGNGFTADVSSSQSIAVPPGTFTVVGNPATDSTNRYFPSISAPSVSIADGGSASVTVDYSTVIPNTTKVLDSTGLASLVVASDLSSITFSSSSSVAGSLTPGDVLAIAPSTAAPSGLLLGIVSVNRGPSTVTATVQSVGLADAIEQATVQYTQNFGPDSLSAASKKLLAPRRAGQSFTAQDTGVCSGNSNTIQLPYSIVLVQDGSGSLSLNGEDDLCASIAVNIQIAHFTLQSFNATVTSGLHTGIGLSDTVQGGFSSSQDLPSLQGKTITVLIGDVPVGVTPTVTPYIGASGSADATVSTGLTTDTSLSLGVSYTNGAWNPVETATSPTAVAASTTANANATIKGWAGVKLGVNVNEPFIPKTGATVSLNGDGYLQLTAGLHRDPCWSLDGGIEGSLGLSAEFLSKDLPGYTSSTKNLYSGNVAQASGPCYTVKITPATQKMDVNQTLQFSATETDLLGNTVDATFNWTSSDTSIATVDASGNVTAVAPGSVTITASDPKTTVAGNATVIVGGAAPTFFMVGNWAGTVTYLESSGVTTIYNVGVSLSQTATTFTGTFTGLIDGDVPDTYTINGQLNAGNMSFTIASTQDTETEDATGTITSNGMQVNGSGVDGSNGSILWDGNLQITGSVSLMPGSVDSSDTVTWTGTISTDGQHLTGSAQSSGGDSVTWNLTRQ